MGYRLLQSDVVNPGHKFRDRGNAPIRHIVLHTAECPWQRGHQWLADYGAKVRSRYVGWNAQVAADGFSFQVPDQYRTYHCIGNSAMSLGVEMVMYAKQWEGDGGEWREDLYENLLTVVASWCREHGVPPVRPSVSEFKIKRVGGRDCRIADASHLEPGIYFHSDLDRDRRSDPGAGFPIRRFLADLEDAVSVGRPVGFQPAGSADNDDENVVRSETDPALSRPAVPMLTTEATEFYQRLHSDLTSIDARPTSLGHLLTFYRILANHYGYDGNQAVHVANALIRELNKPGPQGEPGVPG